MMDSLYQIAKENKLSMKLCIEMTRGRSIHFQSENKEFPYASATGGLEAEAAMLMYELSQAHDIIKQIRQGLEDKSNHSIAEQSWLSSLKSISNGTI